MKKVFIIHGFHGWPNGGWRSWLMSELNKKEIYACALSMPNTDHPVCKSWIKEIARHVDINKNDQIYLVGHSLGTTAILRYLESNLAKNISGAILVSGRIISTENKDVISFLNKSFDFKKIKNKSKNFVVIHGESDPMVPFENGQILSKELNCKFIPIKNAGHLTGSEGYSSLPQVLKALNDLLKI